MLLGARFHEHPSHKKYLLAKVTDDWDKVKSLNCDVIVLRIARANKKVVLAHLMLLKSQALLSY